MNGILNILKPTGMTSHDVVSRVRRITKIKKVGHTGTLDPNAAGVLPICIGQATKVSELILNKDKCYIGELTLGLETDTYDSFGEITNKTEVVNLSEANIYKAFEKYKGEIIQIPPIYSAIKMNGRKLCDLARSGQTDIDINIKARTVNIKELKILNIDENKILFFVTCSKGTYIRSLCKDIGDDLGFGGHMSFLLRTATGNFNIENTITLEELEEVFNEGKINDYLLDIDFTLDKYKSISVKEAALRAYTNGNIVYKKGLIFSNQYEKDELVRVYCENKFYGIGKILFVDNDIVLKSDKLFII